MPSSFSLLGVGCTGKASEIEVHITTEFSETVSTRVHRETSLGFTLVATNGFPSSLMHARTMLRSKHAVYAYTSHAK